MVDFFAVEGEDVMNDGEFGFNVVLRLNAVDQNAANFRAVVATAMRFPTTITDVEVVDSKKIEETSVPGADKYEVSVFVPTEGFPDAGIGSPVEFVLDVVNDRVIDPVTRRVTRLRE